MDLLLSLVEEFLAAEALLLFCLIFSRSTFSNFFFAVSSSLANLLFNITFLFIVIFLSSS